jgi:hypothetical protein
MLMLRTAVPGLIRVDFGGYYRARLPIRLLALDSIPVGATRNITSVSFSMPASRRIATIGIATIQDGQAFP